MLVVTRPERFYTDTLVTARSLDQQIEVAHLADQGVVPCLGVILAEDLLRPGQVDPRSRSYVTRKVEHGLAIGAQSDVQVVARYAVSQTIQSFNTARDDQDNPLVHGTLLQLPLPAYPGESRALLDRRTTPRLALIDPSKDVDGVRPRNPDLPFNDQLEFAAPTPAGIMDILRAPAVQNRVPLQSSSRVVVVGSEGFLVGRHMRSLLAGEGITPVNHDPKLYTEPASKEDLEADMRTKINEADILILCVGRAGLVTPDMLHNDMVIVDAGVSTVEGSLRGDLDPSIKHSGLDLLYTGPTRGTGPMTVVNLWGNVIKSAQRYVATRS